MPTTMEVLLKTTKQLETKTKTTKYLVIIETPYVDFDDTKHMRGINHFLDSCATDDHSSLKECISKITKLLVSLANRGYHIRQDEFDSIGTWYCETKLGSLIVIHLNECNCRDCKGV